MVSLRTGVARGMASTEAVAGDITLGPDGFPNVPRFSSSLLRFLELCAAGATIHSETLEAAIVKTANEEWIYDEERCSAREIVREFRFILSEDDSSLTSAALDAHLVCIEPMDARTIKKEIATAEEEEEEEAPVGRRLAVIDLSGENAIETETFDYGPAAFTGAYPTLARYTLPLHLRLAQTDSHLFSCSLTSSARAWQPFAGFPRRLRRRS